jgi:NAD(P)-dependent dehydrogenase (short-subunit alcohol dehydrogenase family)
MTYNSPPTEETVMEPMNSTAVVVGASRGLGHGIAVAFAEAGTAVVAVARSGSALAELAAAHPNVTPEIADATAAPTADRLLEVHRPQLVVLVAGARPSSAPLQEHTWETFSVNWHTDVQLAFYWLKGVLRLPLRPGSRVIVMSSGAALAGSPLSGGYAGAKATQRLITGYAQDEADRAGLGISFTAVLPRLTPHTDLGLPAVRAYAARYGQTEAEYIAGLGNPVTPEGAGAAILELANEETVAASYLLTGDGLTVLP